MVQRICAANAIKVNVEKYENVFKGLGCLPREVKLTIDESVKPVIEAVRKVPFSLMEKLKKELSRMVEMEVIEEVLEPTDWVSSLTLVEKSDNSIRVCLDPKNLNKAIKRPRFVTPDINIIKAKLKGATKFSVLDAKNGFWMLRLEPASSTLCT